MESVRTIRQELGCPTTDGSLLVLMRLGRVARRAQRNRPHEIAGIDIEMSAWIRVVGSSHLRGATTGNQQERQQEERAGNVFHI